MRSTRAEAEANRNRIIDVAARLFRERGFDGVGIADIMKAAGLTHGGFYVNFKSKEDLVAQACERAMQSSRRRMETVAESEGSDPLAAMVRHYVSARHRDEPGTGCAFAMLAPEAARQGGAVRSVFTEGMRAWLDMLAKAMPGRTAAERRNQAIAALAQMVGAVVLARACDEPALSDEILQAVTADLAATPGRRPTGRVSGRSAPGSPADGR